MWKRQLDCRSLQGGLRMRSVWLFWRLWRGLWDINDGGGGRKVLVGGGSGEAGTAMQMQGLSAITPVTLLSG
jgi:hypothetical protein